MEDIYTIAGLVPYEVEQTIYKLRDQNARLEQRLKALQHSVEQTPSPLTLEEINRALSAGGSHALNVTALVGTPAPTVEPGPPPQPPPVNPHPEDHTDAVVAAKADCIANGIDISGDCGAFEITKRVALLLESIGIGLRDKPFGINCMGYSIQSVLYPDGWAFDILGDAGGANTPQWNVTPDSPIDPGDWRPPIPV